MARTTLDIDAPILRELKRLRDREGKSLGQLASELLSEALARRRQRPEETPAFAWTSEPMEARIDLEDKDALWAALDEEALGEGSR